MIKDYGWMQVLSYVNKRAHFLISSHLFRISPHPPSLLLRYILDNILYHMKEPSKAITPQPASYWTWGNELLFGPTPPSPQEKMDEIEGRMKKLQRSLESECDIKKFELGRLTKELQKAATTSNEVKVREVARECVRLNKLCSSAEARRNKAVQHMDRMQQMRVGGQLSSDMVEYMECNNKLVAKSANVNKVGYITAQYTRQSEAFKLAEEMMEEALEESEDEDKLYEDSQAVEALVKDTMANSGMALLNKLPSIKGVDYTVNNNNNNKNPATLSKNIAQFLEKK